MTVSHTMILACVLALFCPVLDNTRAAESVEFCGHTYEKSATKVNCQDTTLTSIAPVAALENLEILHLGFTKIDDLSPLRTLTKLRILGITATKVKDLTPIRNLKNLEVLRMNWTRVGDLGPLTELRKLTDLEAGNTGTSDITPLRKLTEMKSLNLYYNEITDLTPLKEMKKLEKLELSNTEVDDIDPLRGLTAIRSLNLSNTKVRDISALREMKNLEELKLAYTTVTDLALLASLKNLRVLDISGTTIKDLTPLQSLRLKSLVVMDAELPISQLAALRLPKRRIRGPLRPHPNQPVILLISNLPSKATREHPDWPAFRQKVNAAMADHGFEVRGHNVTDPWATADIKPGLATWVDVLVIFELVWHKKKDRRLVTIAAEAIQPSSARKIATDTRHSESFSASDPAAKKRILDDLATKTCASISRNIKLTLDPARACGRHMWVVIKQPPKNFDFKLHRLLKKHACWRALTSSTKNKAVFHVHSETSPDDLAASLRTDLSVEKTGFTVEVTKGTILIQGKPQPEP